MKAIRIKIILSWVFLLAFAYPGLFGMSGYVCILLLLAALMVRLWPAPRVPEAPILIKNILTAFVIGILIYFLVGAWGGVSQAVKHIGDIVISFVVTPLILGCVIYSDYRVFRFGDRIGDKERAIE